MNPDLEIYNLFNKHGIPVPESERVCIVTVFGRIKIRHKTTIPSYEKVLKEWYHSYSTDELIDRILPSLLKVEKHQPVLTYEDGEWCYVDWSDATDFSPRYFDELTNQALKQLLIWALENYPLQVKEWLERSE